MEKEISPSLSRENKISQASNQPDDHVLPETRWLAIFIIPFLVVAFILLFFWPNDTDKTFAWTIKPSMTPMMLAAAYMGGIWFFVQVVRSRTWHTIKAGFIPVTAFASLLGIATILHWDRFNHSHISFFTWATLYFTTPFLVIALWLRNRTHDPHQMAVNDILLPLVLRVTLGVIGSMTLLVSLFFILSPQSIIAFWPWTLTPLTARVLGAMFSLPGFVGLGIAVEPRWSAARTMLQAQSLSIILILIAAFRARADFNPANIVTWLFLGGLAGMLGFFVLLYGGMEIARASRR